MAKRLAAVEEKVAELQKALRALCQTQADAARKQASELDKTAGAL